MLLSSAVLDELDRLHQTLPPHLQTAIWRELRGRLVVVTYPVIAWNCDAAGRRLLFDPDAGFAFYGISLPRARLGGFVAEPGEPDRLVGYDELHAREAAVVLGESQPLSSGPWVGYDPARHCQWRGEPDRDRVWVRVTRIDGHLLLDLDLTVPGSALAVQRVVLDEVIVPKELLAIGQGWHPLPLAVLAAIKRCQTRL